MTTEISNVVIVILKKCKIERSEVLSDYQKRRFQFQILTFTIVTQNDGGKFHRHFQAMDENSCKKYPSVYERAIIGYYGSWYATIFK